MQLVLDYIHTCIFFILLEEAAGATINTNTQKKHDLYSRETRKASGKLTEPVSESAEPKQQSPSWLAWAFFAPKRTCRIPRPKNKQRTHITKGKGPN
jgi:hypothetical protein